MARGQSIYRQPLSGGPKDRSGSMRLTTALLPADVALPPQVELLARQAERAQQLVRRGHLDGAGATDEVVELARGHERGPQRLGHLRRVDAQVGRAVAA